MDGANLLYQEGREGIRVYDRKESENWDHTSPKSKL